MTFDFDQIDVWGPLLRLDLGRLVPGDAPEAILRRQPKYIEDAFDILLSQICADKGSVVAAVSAWIKSQYIAAYHGSRFTAADIEDVERKGLVTLLAKDRKRHLQAKLSKHPRWPEAAPRLESILEALGNGKKEGVREGQTHATLSRSALVHGFSHYITHGSEFDQRATQYLFDSDALSLLAEYGEPTLVTLAIPGEIAFAAANPALVLVRDMPNLVREVLTSWAYWLAYPKFTPATLEVDCGFVFNHDVPAEWIVRIERITIPSSASDADS